MFLSFKFLYVEQLLQLLECAVNVKSYYQTAVYTSSHLFESCSLGSCTKETSTDVVLCWRLKVPALLKERNECFMLLEIYNWHLKYFC